MEQITYKKSIQWPTNEKIDSCKLIQKGKWANATVFLFEVSGDAFIQKGFCFRSVWIRWLVGTLLTHREISVLKKLEGLPGVPAGVERCGAYCLRYRYMDGITIGSLSQKKEKLPRSYFLAAEELLAQMHRRKVVHLDLRRGENWIVQTNGKLGVIDFQSAISVAFLPQKIREKLYAIDYSGLYKFWDRLGEEPLDPERKDRLRRVNRFRRLWLFRGYALQKSLSLKKSRSAGR